MSDYVPHPFEFLVFYNIPVCSVGVCLLSDVGAGDEEGLPGLIAAAQGTSRSSQRRQVLPLAHRYLNKLIGSWVGR